MFGARNDGRWMIRWFAGGVEKKLSTATGCNNNQLLEARKRALRDLNTFTQRPHEPELVWVESSGEVVEVYKLIYPPVETDGWNHYRS